MQHPMSARTLRALVQCSSRDTGRQLSRRTICTSCLRTYRFQSRLGPAPVAEHKALRRRALPHGGPTKRFGSHSATISERRSLFRVFWGYSDSQSGTKAKAAAAAGDNHGPMAEYDARVHSGRLRDDEHQRSMTEHCFWRRKGSHGYSNNTASSRPTRNASRLQSASGGASNNRVPSTG
jgi:hypothetical protein